MTKHIERIWAPSPSGILVQTGRVTEVSTKSRKDYLEIRTRARQIEELYSEAGISIPSNSSLGELIRCGKDLWENWMFHNADGLTAEVLFSAIQLDRIADALLPLSGDTQRANQLKKLLSGTLNFFKRERSNAKNALWELEAWSKLRKRTTEVYLVEPPDIVVHFQGARIGIACKKVYSERHVQNVLSEAVQQIQNDFEFGIVAVNIDDLLPGDKVLKLGTSKAVYDRLGLYNTQFLQRHDRHFRKYLSRGQLISAIVSSSVISDIETERPRFNNAYQWTIWTVPGLPAAHQLQLDRFYEVITKDI